MDDAGDGGPAFVTDRVSLLFGRNDKFGRARDKLRRDRVGEVGRIDQGRHLLGHGNGKFSGHPADILETARLDQACRYELFWTQDR